MWVGGGVPPPGAPLDTGFRRYDGGGCGKYGSRRRPAPRPCPGFPRKRERRWEGCAGRAGAGGGGGPFDRLRANGISKRACDVGWWGRAAARRTSGYRLSPVRRWRVWEVREAEAPRAAPLPWVPAFAGTTVGGACGTRGGCGGGGPFDRLRANGISKRACDVGWWGRAAARAPLDTGTAAPLDSCLRRNDSGGEAPRCRHLPWVPAFAERRWEGCGKLRGGGVAEGPSTGSGRTESRNSRAPWWGAPPGIPGFRRYDGGGVRERRECGTRGGCGWGRDPSTGSGRTESEARLRCGLVGACRRPAHLPAFRRYDDGGCGNFARRRRCPASPPLQATNGHVPACRGSRLRGNDDTARRRGLRRRPCLWRCRL